MFIRHTTTRNKKDEEKYENYRTEESVRQRTLLHLNTDLSLPKEKWVELSANTLTNWSLVSKAYCHTMTTSLNQHRGMPVKLLPNNRLQVKFLRAISVRQKPLP